MFSAFQTCWDRVDRANIHRQALADIWNALETKKVYSSDAKIDDHGNGKFFVRAVETGWMLPFSLHVGEMLYQLRAALDSCVYDAAILEFSENPPPDKKRWLFPICENSDRFEESVARMKKITDRMRGLVEAVQPYTGATARTELAEWNLAEILNVLNEWSVIDRHRKLHIAGSAITKGNLAFERIEGMRVARCNFEVGNYIIENEAEIANFAIAGWKPGTTMRVNCNMSFEVVVDEAPRMYKFHETAHAMTLSVIAVREEFERAYGIIR